MTQERVVNRRRKEGGNVFSDQIRVGVAVYFLVRKQGSKGCRIHYNSISDLANAIEKQDYLRDHKIVDLQFQSVHPDKNHNWINLTESKWEEFISIASKETKFGKTEREIKTIFKIYSLGVATNRDEWVYDENPKRLEEKVIYFFDKFEDEKSRWERSDNKTATNDFVDRSIKWTSELEAHLLRGTRLEFDKSKITLAMYRPFNKRSFYYDKVIIHRPYKQPDFFKIGEKPNNLAICVNVSDRPFNVLAINSVPDLHFNGDLQCFPLYRFIETGERINNINDWALLQFQKHYDKGGSRSAPTKPIGKEDIFHYVYAVLHNPSYSSKYKQNLKREIPAHPIL